MRKLFYLAILVIAMLFVFGVSANAQTKDGKSFKVGVGAMAGLPLGDVKPYMTLAYGVDLMGEYTIAPSFALTLSGGYLDWVMKSQFKDALNAAKMTVKTGTIPVLGGVNYYFSDKLYSSFQAGLSFGLESGSKSAFTYAPGIGYKIADKFDILLKYQTATQGGGNASFLGLRAGLSF